MQINNNSKNQFWLENSAISYQSVQVYSFQETHEIWSTKKEKKKKGREEEN